MPALSMVLIRLPQHQFGPDFITDDERIDDVRAFDLPYAGFSQDGGYQNRAWVTANRHVVEVKRMSRGGVDPCRLGHGGKFLAEIQPRFSPDRIQRPFQNERRSLYTAGDENTAAVDDPGERNLSCL